MAESAPTRLGLVKGLSARLLILTVFFVMLSEVTVYVPSIARFRQTYLQDKIATAHLATLALEATPDNMVSDELAMRLLRHAGAYAIVLRGPGLVKRALYSDMPPRADAMFDVGTATPLSLITEAFKSLIQRNNRILRVLGHSTRDGGALIEVVIDETPMRLAMYSYSERILALSVAIALATATLIFVSLRWLIVRPIRGLTKNMMGFRENPEDASRVIVPSGRNDEIGMAERELAVMQQGLRTALTQKARLAALGVAVTKISHDLRNILTTASLVSDRLAAIHDPDVVRMTPPLVSTIDRAVNLCTRTLEYARDEPPPPRLTRFRLRDLVAEVGGDQALANGSALTWDNMVADELEVAADRDQLIRVLVNLERNAAEAGAKTVRISATTRDGRIAVTVADDGPGIPERAKRNLFQPFVGSTRAGGTGLGLAIAREIMRAHGGDIMLAETSKSGAVFRLDLPAASAAALAPQ
ncbi:MAG: HAMP domain-containing sensor histidine kinase, partial [Alphaproteobacteria bacterium]